MKPPYKQNAQKPRKWVYPEAEKIVLDRNINILLSSPPEDPFTHNQQGNTRDAGEFNPFK